MTNSDKYCLISKVMLHNANTQYLGACWYIMITFVNINSIINHNNHVQKSFFPCLINSVSSIVIIEAIERNIHTGYTAHSLFNSLFNVSGFTAIIPVLIFQIKLSQNTKNIHNGINDIAMAKNKISAQTLLFSCLFIDEKNISIAMIIQPNIHTKWKWYPYGFNISRNADHDVGIMVHWLFKKKYTYAQNIYAKNIASGKE